MKFGEYIKHKRGDRPLRELADYLGISPGYLSDIETGRRPAPAGEKLENFMYILDIPITDRNYFLDLAAESRAGSKNEIPADIYEYIKNPGTWPQLRQFIKDRII